ncbi:translocation/assembly module TamB domain-containing protein [Flavobacterium sp.]|uniref:translocation/assembly module TamB domain-containing protein n=1 Tax=Flavobacterium sp. TaxID=239 RepID=UPI0037507924
MKEKSTNTKFKTFIKIVFRTLIVLIIILLGLGIALSLPSVQTKIAHYITDKFNKDFGTDINVEQVEVTIFGGVQLKKVMIKDFAKDTLIYAKRINTSILDVSKVMDGDLLFGKIDADDLTLKIKTYKGQKDTSLDKFIAAFEDGKKSTRKFLMKSEKITLSNSKFILLDDNLTDPKNVDFSKLNAVITNFEIYGPEVKTNIEKMSFVDHRGLTVENLKSKFTYTKTNIKLENLDFKTKESKFVGKVILKYDRKDFVDFNNKVIFDIKTDAATIASNEIRYFYKEIAKDQQFNLNAKIDGTLNNFTIKKLNLIDSKNSQIIGDVSFRNLFAKKNKGEFYMKGSFDKVSSSYDDLTALLPNILGKKLPTSLKKLGKFNLEGDAEITTKTIDADFTLNTKLGNVVSNLVMTNINNIDNATYAGTILLDNFDIGTFLNRKDVGKVSLDIDVDGKGFTEKYLDVKFNGDVKSVKYNGYTYQNIIADGSFKKPFFNGKVSINDPNLFVDFDGIVNLNKKENIYDFHATVDYINLKKLNFVKDSISIFRGDVVMKVRGNSVNNLTGEVTLTNASYQNPKDIYFFDKLAINSSFDNENTRKITIKSSEGIDGEVEGKFDLNQVPNMIQNSLGSLYTNYNPNSVKKNQFLKFNFKDFNKIVEIISPEISMAPESILFGSINSNDNDFKFNFESIKINAFNVELDNVKLEIDNKNPLYNTYIQMDSIKTKHYKVRDFSLINVTSNDTLNFRTEFKGGNLGNDYYNLNLYHTINSEKKNVIGFGKSEMMFKDFLWYLNEEENDKNKVVFDKSLKNFAFEDIVVSHENQSVKLNGFINGKSSKDLQLSFKDVNLNKITPDVPQFKFDGNLNGDVFLKQNNLVYQPTASLAISNLFVNDNELGTMNLNIEGNDSFSKFNIDSVIENENFDSFKAKGNLAISNEVTAIDLDLNFKKFNLGVLSNLGGKALSNIRGFVSGNARIDGNINNVDYNGRLFVDESGLTIPYLNVDYLLKPNSIVDVTKDKFIIQPTTITDTKYKTEGNLQGYIQHKQFADWKLDIRIDSDRLLALNTKDNEDAAYFGTAFINGSAKISGPTNALVIDVKAESEKGTDIKIPINDAESVGENSYIHFITEKEKYNKDKNIIVQQKRYEGLEMNFDFEITPVANIEVILDRDSGHGMKASGKGGLLFRINTLGKFEMYGDFVVDKGTYNFKYGGIIDKKFDVKQNSNIVWEGDPFKAVLDLEAIYKTTANPAVLINNSSFNKKIDVEVSIDVKGTIKNPEPDFNINFPRVSSILKSEIQTKLDDKDTRQTQALYLLSTGGFLSQDGLSQSQYTNFAFEKAGVLFSDLFNDTDGKLQLGFDYVQGDKTPGLESDGRFGVTLSTKINERITINGKIGVPTGGVSETAVVGNFELEYRVNDDGTLNLRVFNRENEINYIGQGVGYTQGIGMNYEVDFDTFKELVNKIFTKHKIEKVNKSNNNIDDSNLLPDYIQINEKDKDDKKSSDEISKPNQEALPKDD